MFHFHVSVGIMKWSATVGFQAFSPFRELIFKEFSYKPLKTALLSMILRRSSMHYFNPTFFE